MKLRDAVQTAVHAIAIGLVSAALLGPVFGQEAGSSDPAFNSYRISQLEKRLEKVEADGRWVFNLLLATLATVIVNMGLYLATRKRRQDREDEGRYQG